MDFQERCIASLEGSLSEEAEAELQAEINSSAEKQKVYEQYRELLSLENKVSEEGAASLGAGFTVKVMEAIEEEESRGIGFFRRYFSMKTKFIAPVATVAVLVICVLTVQQKNLDEFHPSSMIGAEMGTELGAKMQQQAPTEMQPAPQSHSYSDLSDEKAGTYQPDAGFAAKEAPKQVWEEEALGPQKNIQRQDGRLNEKKEARIAPATPDIEASSQDPMRSVPAERELDQLKKDYAGADMANAPVLGDSLLRDRAQSEKRISSPTTETDYEDLAEAFRSDLDSNRRRTEQSIELKRKKSGVFGGGAEGAGSRGYRAPTDKHSTKPVPGGSITSHDDALVSQNYGKMQVPPRRYTPEPSSEEYGIYEENKRTLVSVEPRSTFSFDVDSGSYTNMRRFLRMGTLPPPQSVRVEEFVNYFEYSYPKQAERPFSVHYEMAPSPFAKGRQLLKIGVKARDSLDSEESKPWNLVFLIDVSGSMDTANKLPLLKKSMTLLAKKMRAKDRIAIVTYSNGARVALSPTEGAKKGEIVEAINRLQAGGGTNGSAGIEEAYRITETAGKDFGVNRVILATDGDFNQGVTDFGSLIRMIEQKRRSGISLTTLGFGQGNYKEKTLEQLANKGNGNYFYIDSFAEARRVLSEKLVSTIEVVAKDVKLQIEFNPEQVVEYRLVGYDNRVLSNSDFADDSVDAGEIGAGHSTTAVYEVVLSGSELAADLTPELRYQTTKPKKEVEIPKEFSNELAFVKIRYKKPSEDSSSKMQFPIEQSGALESYAEASADFRFATTVAAFAQLLRQSKFAAGYSIADVLKEGESAVSANTSSERREFIELVKNAKELLP